MRLGRIVVLGCLLETVAWGASDREIRVRIQDYRGISPKLWTESLAVAEAILDAAGVKPLWLNCSLSLEDQMDSGCRTKPRPRDIFLRLVPQRNAQRAGFKTACMGYALLPKEGFGVLATVFAETVREKADRSLTKRFIVLGHAIAHEIGHLLLGNPGHSGEGLMKAVWSPTQLLRATASPMKFSEREIRRIQQDLRSRAELSPCMQTAAWGATDREIQVRIEDYAGIPSKVRTEALDLAESILRTAGAQVVWLQCPPSAAERMDARCASRPEPADIFVRLMPERMAAKLSFQADCLGFAIVPERSFGRVAAVFWDKARRAAVKWGARRSTVLGHAIAHEIGHLLIAERGHSRRGLMKARWSQSEIRHANKVPMEFNSKDKRRIQQNLRARLDAMRQG